MTRLELSGLVLELTDEQVEEARRQLGVDRPSGGLVDLATAAEVLGCSRDFLYDHAPEYGGRKVGARWKFDRRRLERAGDNERPSTAAAEETHKPRRRRRKKGARLLEVRGQEA